LQNKKALQISGGLFWMVENTFAKEHQDSSVHDWITITAKHQNHLAEFQE
jgi:hypothetical protein